MGVRFPKHVFPGSRSRSRYVWSLGFQNTFFLFPVPDLVSYGHWASQTGVSGFRYLILLRMRVRLPNHVFSCFWYPISSRLGVELSKNVFAVSGTRSPYVWALGFQNTFFSGFRYPISLRMGVRLPKQMFPVPDLVAYAR